MLGQRDFKVPININIMQYNMFIPHLACSNLLLSQSTTGQCQSDISYSQLTVVNFHSGKWTMIVPYHMMNNYMKTDSANTCIVRCQPLDSIFQATIQMSAHLFMLEFNLIPHLAHSNLLRSVRREGGGIMTCRSFRLLAAHRLLLGCKRLLHCNEWS